MRTTSLLRIGKAALVFFAIFGPVAPVLSEADRPGNSHEFSFRSDSDAELAEWALARFEQAGLQLPPLLIAFHDEKEACNGHFGYYRPSEPAQVDICGFNWDRMLVTPKRTMLHELGHAWAHHNLTDQAREAFIRFRGLAAWDEDSVPWEDQGSEHAAEIIAWTLMEEEILLTSIGDAAPQTLGRAYELLTSDLHPSR